MHLFISSRNPADNQNDLSTWRIEIFQVKIWSKSKTINFLSATSLVAWLGLCRINIGYAKLGLFLPISDQIFQIIFQYQKLTQLS